jgi:3'-5' exoribonuclease
MWKTVQNRIDSLENPHLKALVHRIYADFEEEIQFHPGSVSHHHLYRGGFLEHVWSLIQVGEMIAEHYFELDRDLFLSGLFLHDIGKLLEIKSDVERQYTDEGQFVGHIVLGRDIIRETVREHIPEFPDDLLLQLEHIILSHQSETGKSASKRPVTLEALVVSMLDRMDTRIYQFLETLETDPNAGEWTLPTSNFPYPLYKGKQQLD